MVGYECTSKEVRFAARPAPVRIGGHGLVLVARVVTLVAAEVQFDDLLGVNEWQEGQCGSSWQVRWLMPGDHGHLRTMRLLPFAATA
jgi:hypothetical protein